MRHADDFPAVDGYPGVALNSQPNSPLPTPVVPPRTDAPSPAALRRVLRRARDGVALNVDEAAIAMTARGGTTGVGSGLLGCEFRATPG